MSLAHPADKLPDDYEECGYCNCDHSYEYAEAKKWHEANPCSYCDSEELGRADSRPRQSESLPSSNYNPQTKEHSKGCCADAESNSTTYLVLNRVKHGSSLGGHTTI